MLNVELHLHCSFVMIVQFNMIAVSEEDMSNLALMGEDAVKLIYDDGAWGKSRSP